MSISCISSCISSSLFSVDKSHKTKAIALFGKELAESLQSKERSWKKLMASWNVLYEACVVIKDSNDLFLHQPKRINCDVQSNDGLIFQMSRYTRHSTCNTEGILITPFGYFSIECKTTEAMYRFIKRLEEKFHTKLLEDRDTKYSFTLFPNKEASFKSLYDRYGSKQIEEIGKYAFTRSQVVAVYAIIRNRLHMEIEEVPL